MLEQKEKVFDSVIAAIDDVILYGFDRVVMFY